MIVIYLTAIIYRCLKWNANVKKICKKPESSLSFSYESTVT